MQWGKRRFQKDEYAPWVDEFEEIYVGLIGPRMMLMVSTEVENESDKIDMWVHAHDVFFTGRFIDFETVPPGALPKTAVLLLGNLDDFLKIFPIQAGSYDKEIRRHREERSLAEKLLHEFAAKNGESNATKETTDEIARLRRNIKRQNEIIAAYERCAK